MKPLLDRCDAKYLRRLSRELNANVDGFYTDGRRYLRSMFSRDTLWIRGSSRDAWQAAKPDAIFVDAYGREICASRVS